MTLLKELETARSYLQLPELAKERIKFLTFPDWYDGPISGLLLYAQQKYWYQRVAEASDQELEEGSPFYRHYIVVELTAEQLSEEEYWDELFRQKVSDNPSYDETGKPVAGKVQPVESWAEFYEPYNQRQPLDLSNNSVVGWFER